MFQIGSSSDKRMRLVQHIWQKLLPGLSGYSCPTIRVKDKLVNMEMCFVNDRSNCKHLSVRSSGICISVHTSTLPSPAAIARH